MGLTLDVGVLFKIRANVVSKLAADMKLSKVEVPYELVMKEVYYRLINSNILDNVEWLEFYNITMEADYRSETSVQFINASLVDGLKFLKSENYSIYIVSDYHLPKSIILRLLD
ncbi:MAG: hypothetical protein ABJM50_14850, partial [Nonlabens ulvanivorans]|uniref:hypothetical protein n=1 Tax=Nonlabens ulvanivorans TaxID=906888 RepID=UPI00329A6048